MIEVTVTAECWLTLLIICDLNGDLLPGLYAGIETARLAAGRCQIRAGVCERRLCDGMRSTASEMCEHHCKYITIRKIVLGEGESHGSAICRGEVRRVERQCTARGNVDLRDVNDDIDGITNGQRTLMLFELPAGADGTAVEAAEVELEDEGSSEPRALTMTGRNTRVNARENFMVV